tara:strand:- start:65 stop:2476 length:2412 start_codon:yes stop_codon:yes gene_type:complete
MIEQRSNAAARCSDGEDCNSDDDDTTTKGRAASTVIASIPFGAATRSLYVDASTGIAKSDNLLSALFKSLCQTEGEERASDLLCGTEISCAWRVKEICRLLEEKERKEEDAFQLWSWMATNVRALCWNDDDDDDDDDDDENKNLLERDLPYQVQPSLQNVLNCSMTVDITALLCLLDFFGTNHGPVTLSKKRRAPKDTTGDNDAMDYREATGTLAFLLNKALPNRCVVRDFLMVLKGACGESRYVDEAFRRLTIVGLIGGYATARKRLRPNGLAVVIRGTQHSGWFDWLTATNARSCKGGGGPDSKQLPQQQRQTFAIWMTREHILNGVADVPSLRRCIEGTHVGAVLDRSRDVMDRCRQRMQANVDNGLWIFDGLNDILPRDHGCGGEGRHLRQQSPPHLQEEPWRLATAANELECYDYEALLESDTLRGILSFVTGSNQSDLNRHFATRPHSFSLREIATTASRLATEEALLSLSCEPPPASQADDFLAAIQARKSQMKANMARYRATHVSKGAAVLNLLLLVCCKQVLFSRAVSAHRIDDGGDRGAAEGTESDPRCVQVCQWCNRWQTISSDAAYKKGTPALGRFVIDGLNRLHCAGHAPSSATTSAAATMTMDHSHLEKVATKETAVAVAATTTMQQQESPQNNRPALQRNRFSLCKYIAADRWCLRGIAFVSSQWLVCTCLNCDRPYVREFTAPETLRRVCKQCRKAVTHKTHRTCEVCMKHFRCTRPTASSGGGGAATAPHLVYDDYNSHHRFRLIDTCASCHTKLNNMKRYEHLSLGACVAAATREPMAGGGQQRR